MPLDLVAAVDAYQNRQLSLDGFEDRFRDQARGMFAESSDVLAAFLAIDSGFSELRYGLLNEEQFREEVAAAIRPFSVSDVVVVRKLETSAIGSARRIVRAQRSYNAVSASVLLCATVAAIVVVQQDAVRNSSSSASPVTLLCPLDAPSV